MVSFNNNGRDNINFGNIDDAIEDIFKVIQKHYTGPLNDVGFSAYAGMVICNLITTMVLFAIQSEQISSSEMYAQIFYEQGVDMLKIAKGEYDAI